MVLSSTGDARAVSAEVAKLGFVVRKVKFATADDVQEYPQPREQLFEIRRLLRDRMAAEAERRRLDEENERRWAVEAEAEREAEAHREALARAEEQRRYEVVFEKATGDFIGIDPEADLHGNTVVAAICAKVALFFGSEDSSREAILTSIKLDFATFQAHYGYPRSTQLLNCMIGELSDYAQIDHAIAGLNYQVRDDAHLVQSQINSIASRSHIFGGSGDGLILSWLAAEMGVRDDKKQVMALQQRHAERTRKAAAAATLARRRQSVHKFRAEAVASILLAGCGRSARVDATMPADVMEYLAETWQL
jgi:hypothetical protein